MKIVFTLALFAALAVPIGADNISPNAVEEVTDVTCPAGDCLTPVQEIPGTSTGPDVRGVDVASSLIRYSFPDPDNTTGTQEFVLHASSLFGPFALRGEGVAFNVQLWEDGSFVRHLLVEGEEDETVLFLDPNEQVLVGFPWEFSELSDTSGAGVEVNIRLWGTECPAPPIPCNPARIEAIGWKN